MEATQTAPGGLGPQECADLAATLAQPGPFTTCYLNTQAASEDARHRIEIRWANLRRELEAAGTPRADLAALAGALRDARRAGEAVGVVARGGAVALFEADDAPVANELGECAELPRLCPLLAWRQGRLEHVLVECDRAGAHIVAAGPGGAAEAEAGGGRHDPGLHKPHAGGWSEPRYDKRVEENWERNARAVAAAVDDIATATGARVVLFGGDEHACGLLDEHASARLKRLLARAPLSRAADGSEHHEARAVGRALATAAAADTAGVLAALAERRAHALGIDGPAVLGALRAAQVETLLVVDRPDDERRAFFSREPAAVGATREELSGLGGRIGEDRLVDVAVYGAFATGARVRVVPAAAGINGGIAALLRFDSRPVAGGAGGRG